MKRFVIGCLASLFLAPTLWAAAPWGALEEIDWEADHAAVDDPLHILKKITSGKIVFVHFTFETKDEEKNAMEIKYFLNGGLPNTYKFWLKATAEWINESGNPAQFPQVLERLNQSVKLFPTSDEKKADLRVFVASSQEMIYTKCEDKEAAACVDFSGEGKGPELIFPSSDFVDNGKYSAEKYGDFMIHELGHTLGLNDMYNNFPRDSHSRYHSTGIPASIMMADGDFSCDDADGLINLIDVLYGTEPARAAGWHSLCEYSKDVYLNGVVVGSGSYELDYDLENPAGTIATYQGGKKISEQTFPFTAADPFVQIPDKQVLQKDHLGRPVRAVGPNGEDIYYEYKYNERFRLVIKDGKTLAFESFKEMYCDDGAMCTWEKSSWFLVPPKRWGVLEMTIDKEEGGNVTYTESDVDQAWEAYAKGEKRMDSIFGIAYELNKNGKITPAVITDGKLPPPAQVKSLGTRLYQHGAKQLQQWGFSAQPAPQVRKPNAKAGTPRAAQGVRRSVAQGVRRSAATPTRRSRR
ncbi:MAG: hypothetical protein J6X06_03530 [Elusimicrobiaceae bacterium]|nr:hypothetical protein [Elusimicrobiaceae bacterium]